MARMALTAVLALSLLPIVAWGQSVDPSQWPLGGGKDEQNKDKPAADKPAEAPAEAAWTTLKTQYKMVKKFDFALPPSGATAQVAGAEDGSVAVQGRLALPSTALACTKDGKKLGIDLDGDAKPDVWIKSEKDVQQLELTYEGAGKEPYAIELNRSGDAWTYSRSCLRQATFKGQRIVLVDNNSDGAYDKAGVDAMLVGNARVPAYVGSQIALSGKIYEVKVNRSGSEIQVRECTVATGKVDLQSGFKASGKLVGAVMSDGQRSFEVSAPGTVVPVGTYTLSWGVVDGGSRNCMFRASISVTVSEGQVAKVDFGAPFRIDFDATRNGTQVQVSAGSLKVFGKASEEYYAFSNKLIPHFEVRDEKTKTGLCKGKMATG